MPEIEVYTARYEREHGRKPVGRGFWKFTLVSGSPTVRDHFLDLTDEQRTYQRALERAKKVAGVRRSVRIIVEP